MNAGVALLTTATVTNLTATGASVASANVGTAVVTGLTVTGASIASVNAGVAVLSGNLTLNGGTANGVLYLNGSKVATSGSALVFDGTNLGVGTASPAAKLESAGTSNGATLELLRLNNLGSGANTQAQINFIAATNSYATITGGFGASVPQMTFNLPSSTLGNYVWQINNTERMRLDSSGNLGLGVVPSAFTSTIKALQIGSTSVFRAGDSGFTQATIVASNARQESAVNYYIANGFATDYTQQAGAHIWYNAASGTAGNTISFTQAMTLDASGNLGVGTTGPGTRLDVRGPMYVPAANFKAVAQLYSTDSQATGNGAGITLGGVFTGTDVTSFAQIAGIKENSTDNNYAGALVLYSRPNGDTLAERARITSGGDFLIGTTTSTLGRLEVVGGAGIRVNEDAAGTKVISIRSAFAGGDPAINVSTNHPLTFLTNNTERGRFTAGGDLLVGITGDNDPSGAIVRAGLFSGQRSASASTCFQAWNQATTGDNVFVQFYTEGAGGTLRGSIDYNRAGGLTRYNTTSDYRAKDVYGLLDDSGETIDALKVYRGKMHGATMERPMLIAHEAQETAPYAVTGEKDAVNDDGDPIYQQMDTSSLVPLLIAEIQSLRSRVSALEAK